MQTDRWTEVKTLFLNKQFTILVISMCAIARHYRILKFGISQFIEKNGLFQISLKMKEVNKNKSKNEKIFSENAMQGD